MTPVEFRDEVAAQLADTPIWLTLRERERPYMLSLRCEFWHRGDTYFYCADMPLEGPITPEMVVRVARQFREEHRRIVGVEPPENDPTSPDHYKQHPSGVECITIVEHLNFCLGNAIKYIWRAGLKGDALDDLRKARWYIDREIVRRGGGGS